ncbi:MAG: hypothetical protein DLM64_00045, partial [Solirubrobacterales bacterium]
MPRGDKSSYTDKQKREAEHIEKGYEQSGVSEKESERRAWATVNKQDGGGKKSGSGKAGGAEKKSSAKKSSAKKTGTKKSAAKKKSSTRKSTRKSSRSKQR